MSKFIVGLFLFVLASTNSTLTLADAAFDRVIKNGQINCGTYVFNGLFAYAPKTNTPEGFIPDLMAEVGKRLNVAVKWTEIGGLAQVFEELEQGRYDMLCAPFLVDGNLYKKTIWGPALTYDPVLVYGDTAKDYSAIKSLAELNAPTYAFVGMDGELGGTFVPTTFLNAKLVMLSQGSTPGQMLMELFSGKVNFVVFGRIAFQAYERDNPGKLKQMPTEPIAMMPLRNGFPKDADRLRDLYSAVIEDMRHDGTLDRLLRKYGFGDGIKP